MGGAFSAIVPGGSGLSVAITNHAGSPIRVVIRTGEDGESWCAPLLDPYDAEIPWSDFRTQCWTDGGDAYDPDTPIAQVIIEAHGASDSVPTAVDFCMKDLRPLP
jgi:hypothetical protein